MTTITAAEFHRSMDEIDLADRRAGLVLLPADDGDNDPLENEQWLRETAHMARAEAIARESAAYAWSAAQPQAWQDA